MESIKKFSIVFIVLLLAGAIVSSSAEAATYYVNNQMPGAWDGNPGTIDAPWETVQYAADVLQPGDTVIVKPGVYSEAVRLSVSGTKEASIVFKGEPGAIMDGSTLDGWGYNYGFSNRDPNQGWGFTYVDFIRIEGFEIRNFMFGIYAYPAYRNWETGESLGANGWSVVNNVVHDDYHTGINLWGGASLDAGNIVVANFLYNNRWTDIHVHQYSVVERNVALSHAEQENVRACTANYQQGATHKVNNNTLLNGAYGILISYPGSEYKNNVIMNIQPRYNEWAWWEGGFAFNNRLDLRYYDLSAVNISYNDLFNVAEPVGIGGYYTEPQQMPDNAVGNISADPLFVNNTGDHTGDYHLTAASPCIDAGDPADPVSAGGGSRIDIGAYEYPRNDIPSLISKKHEFYDAGLIDNKGIMTSLDAKLDAAQAALVRGQTKAARNILNALINEVKAQRSKHIENNAALSLMEDAEMILRSIDIIEKGNSKK